MIEYPFSLLRNTLFLITLGFSLPLWSQPEPAQVTWGDVAREPSGSVATKIVGITPEGMYVLRQKNPESPSSKSRAWVEFVSRDLRVLRSKELDLKYKGKQRDFEDLLYFNSKLYLLTSFNNTAHKRNYLFVQEVSTKSLLPVKSLNMIAETEAKNKEVEGTFGIEVSKDSSHLLVYYDLPHAKNQPVRFGFHIFDRDFQRQWEKNVLLPYSDDRFTVEEYRIDEAGNVYLLGVLYSDNAKYRRRGSPNYQYVLLAYLDEGRQEVTFNIELPDKLVSDLTFRVGNDGNLVFAGFYSDKGSYSIKGSYFFHLDPFNSRFSNQHQEPFDFDFLTAFMSEKNKARAMKAESNQDTKNAPELYDYSLDKLILRSDGGAVLIAEQFYIESETYRDYYSYGYYPLGYYSPYNRQTDYLYNYNNIIVVNIRPDGTLQWTARIPKWQETRNDGGYFSSYSMSVVRDKLYFIYNDNARNFDPKRKQHKIYKYSGQDEVIVLAELNISGEVTLYPLFAASNAGVSLRPKLSRQIGLWEMLWFGEANKGYRLGKLTFSE